MTEDAPGDASRSNAYRVPDVDVYICGLKAMVDEVSALLELPRLDPRSVLCEKYD